MLESHLRSWFTTAIQWMCQELQYSAWYCSLSIEGRSEWTVFCDSNYKGVHAGQVSDSWHVSLHVWGGDLLVASVDSIRRFISLWHWAYIKFQRLEMFSSELICFLHLYLQENIAPTSIRGCTCIWRPSEIWDAMAVQHSRPEMLQTVNVVPL